MVLQNGARVGPDHRRTFAVRFMHATLLFLYLVKLFTSNFLEIER